MNTTAAPRTGEPEPPRDAPLLPGEPLSVRLMNTVWADTDGVHDSLADAGGLRAWLTAVAPALPGGAGDALREHSGQGGKGGHSGTGRHRDPGPGELPSLLPEFRRLRDALRALAAATTGDTRPAAVRDGDGPVAAAAAVDRACAQAPSWSHLAWPPDSTGNTPVRTLRSAHSPAAAALSLVAEDAARLFAGDGRTALRACHAPGCVLYFLRTNPRREWCSPGCGNRARVARHYQRHHARPTG